MLKEASVSNLHIEVAQPEDADWIWTLIRSSFKGPHMRYIATGQDGYEFFLRDFIDRGESNDRQLFVCKVDGHRAGFADVILPNAGPNFLTRIAVSSEFQGQSISTRMLEQIQLTAASTNVWKLDVFSDNTHARGVYDSLGFQTETQNTWLARIIGHKLCSDQALSSDANDESYARYGFTKTVVENRLISIAGSAIRCQTGEELTDDRFLSAVQDFYPEVDRAFIIASVFPNRYHFKKDIFEVARSLRLTGVINPVTA